MNERGPFNSDFERRCWFIGCAIIIVIIMAFWALFLAWGIDWVFSEPLGL